jgi:hypothetical protein
MSIRVQCEKCGSVLKIKEELAGTQGKCPKCKSPFVVPQVGESDAAMPVAVGQAAAAVAASEPSKSEPRAKAPPQKPAKSPADAESGRKADAGLHTNGPPATDGNKSTDHDMPAITDKPPVPPKPPAAKSSGDEFDPAEFLMAEGGPKPKPAPQPPRPEPPAPGRRPPGGKRLELSDDETEVPGPQETLTPAPRPPARTTAAEMANAMLTSGAATSASAKDLLAKSAQDSRSRASQMPDEGKRARTDYFALGREMFRAFGVYIIGTVFLCAALYWMMSRMFADEIPLPTLAEVHGTVTLGGKPLANVQVYFTPIGVKDEQKLRPRDSMATTDAEGKYELLYLPEERIYGAVVGKNRVWLSTDNRPTSRPSRRNT